MTVPAEYRDVAAVLYGGAVDPRELWALAKAMPDSGDLSLPGQQGQAAPPKPRRRRGPSPAVVGLADDIPALVATVAKDATALTPAGQQAKENRRRKALAGALVLGTAAEGFATFRAGEGALKAVRQVGKAPLSSKKGVANAAHIGEFGLQAANMGIGLTAAHKLNQPAKPKQPVTKALGSYGKYLRRTVHPRRLRPVVHTMTDTQAAKYVKHTEASARAGQRVLLGGAALAAGTAGAYGASTAAKRRQSRGDTTGSTTTTVVKGLLPVPKPLGLKTVTTGMGPGPGLGRHGRQLGPSRGVPNLGKADTVEATWTADIAKVDTDQRLVFGWFSLSKVDGEPVVDRQNDWIPIEETERSAYDFVLHSRKGGDMHRRVSKFGIVDDEPHHTADLVESVVITPEKLKAWGLAEDALPHGWWGGFKVHDDDQWQLVKSGQRRAFSVHGTGRRTEIDL